MATRTERERCALEGERGGTVFPHGDKGEGIFMVQADDACASSMQRVGLVTKFVSTSSSVLLATLVL